MMSLPFSIILALYQRDTRFRRSHVYNEHMAGIRRLHSQEPEHDAKRKGQNRTAGQKSIVE